jgi:hypothetical protein
MKQLFRKYASWFYGLSAALLFCGAVIWIIGWHRYLGVGLVILGVGLAVATDAIVPPTIRGKYRG